ncbi:plastocyanin/azurin family copper-binding protein [Halomarina halobia]|uniref:Plastocyanin/azurin family copper-binding protein n=1 Tax=Halomarina halobia TaxID=3033386 RepID=A0ABD6A7N7_9EURY|nr:plastocyanin/azurin family copper-binding protein [Halomarina sp. PSR21]
MARTHTRRNWLKTIGAAGVGASVVSLAGCTSDQGSNGDGNGGGDGGDGNGGGGSGSDGNGGGGGTQTVEMTDELTFEPKEIEVSAGTTVVWENVGSVGHTVTAYEDEIPEDAAYFASGDFDSEQAAEDGYPDQGNITEGGTYEHTFETSGTYEYYCIPHEMNGMVGTVTVS